MAEAFLNQLCGDTFEAHSAGLEPGKLNPIVVEAMNEVGIDISGRQTKAVFDYFNPAKYLPTPSPFVTKPAPSAAPFSPVSPNVCTGAFPIPPAFPVSTTKSSL